MGLETGTFISDLVVTNPPSGDPIAQGDDHIRLLKTTLKNTFPTASRAVYSPSTRFAAAGTTVATVADQNCVFQLYTNAGQVNLFMPTLSAGDAGWSCTVMKWGADLSPAFVFPPSGTLLSGDVSVAYCRRCIPYSPKRVFWTGGNWVAERVPSVPVGTVLEYQGAGLPAGYEWPNGQTLPPGSYPEFAAVRTGGLTQDRRGRYGAMADQGAGRIGGGFAGGINTGAYDGVGGEYVHQITAAEMYPHTHGFVTGTSNQDINHTHPYNEPTLAYFVGSGGLGGYAPSAANTGSPSVDLNSHNHSGNTDTGAGVGGANHNNLPPTLVTHFILVVE